MTGSVQPVPAFFSIRKYPSFTAKYKAVKACIKWNEKQTAQCVRKHSRVKNYDRRRELERNATRHTSNAQRLRKIVAEVE